MLEIGLRYIQQWGIGREKKVGDEDLWGKTSESIDDVTHYQTLEAINKN